MPRRKKEDADPTEGKIVKFDLLNEADFVAAKAVIEEVDPLLRRNVMALIHKKVHSMDSFAKYVVRQLVRHGIFCTYTSDITPLPDGFRLTIEVRLAAVNADVVRRKMKTIYMLAFDMFYPCKKWRQAEKKIEEELEKQLEETDVEVSQGVS